MADPPEVIRRWLRALNARDLDGLLALAHPEIVVRPLRFGVRAEYHGHEGIGEWVAAAPAGPRISSDLMRVLAPGRVLVEGRIDGLDERFVAIFELRDGLILDARAYLSDRDLLEQLGRIESGSGARSQPTR
jgi:hypothetical protein